MSRGLRKNNQAVEEMEEDARFSSEVGEHESGMMAMLRVLMEEQRRAEVAREEARRQEEERKEQVRLEQQAALEARQYEQQLALLKIQAEIGEKASRAYRDQQSSDRKRDRALFSVPVFKEGEDIEEFLLTAERRLRAAEIPQGEWIPIIDTKLGGTLATAWQDITVTVLDYQEAKGKLLKVCGYTPRLAADAFFGFRADQSKGMTADQLFHRGQQLLRRMIAPGKAGEDVEFAILRSWIVTKRARAALDARLVNNSAELINALQDHLVLEGDRSEGQAAIFRKAGSEGSRDRMTPLTCFKCGKVGHKAVDCWTGKGGVSGSKVGPTVAGGVASKITCYTCGEEGHKSPLCPKNLKGEKNGSREGKAKPVKRIWRSQSNCVQLGCVVNGQEAQILLDSGAAISVVPETMVAPNQLTGNNVAVRPFGAKTPMLLPTAEISFRIKDLEWVECAAVAPKLEGTESEVLCSLDLQSKRGLELVLLANGVDQKEVFRVTTRAQAKADRQEEETEVAAIAKEGPKAKPLVVNESNGQGVSNEPKAEEEFEGSKKEILGGQEEEIEKILCIEEDASDDEEEEVYRMREESESRSDLVIPPVKPIKHSRVHLIEETKIDPSLQQWRELAGKGEKGLVWKEGLLYQSVTTQVLESVFVLVLPKSFRTKVMKLAHDNLGHMGARRVKSILKARFVWPGMGQDVVNYCRSCPSCQTCAKNPARKVPRMERTVMTEPFEVMGFDIVGPMPKGRGGCRFLLTAICMATRWPEAIPLRGISAKSVAVRMMDIFSRTGIPLQLLTDQGAQFVGAVMTTLCSNLHIDKIKTTPYHPEGNGVVERMHGTLGAMLTKAAKEGQDWVGQVPFALFALRAAPNRDTQFSPFELVYGRSVRTPLDIVHQGWAELEFEQLNVEEWAQWLVEKLEVWHDVMRNRGEEASRKRKIGFDKKAVNRELEEGDLVLCRIPGMAHKLEEAWQALPCD